MKKWRGVKEGCLMAPLSGLGSLCSPGVQTRGTELGKMFNKLLKPIQKQFLERYAQHVTRSMERSQKLWQVLV